MTRRLAALAALALGAAACGASAGIGSSQDPIMGGTNDSNDPAVALLYIQSSAGTALCSSEVLSPHVLLTAAHCVDPAVVGSGATFGAYFGSDPMGGTATFDAVTETHFDPVFNSAAPQWGDDVGIAILANPAPATPLALNRVAPPSSWVGTNLRLVGFGKDSPCDTIGATAGIKRTVTIPLLSEDNLFLWMGNSSQSACEGDSGGAAFTTQLTGEEIIAGITSFGMSTCGYGADTRVDLYTSFIDPYIQMFDPGYNNKMDGATCAASAECASSLCAPLSGGSGICAETCANGVACASGTTCVKEMTGAEACVPTADAPSHGGGGCSTAPGGVPSRDGWLLLVGVVAGMVLRRRRSARRVSQS